jgi:hypothetical protein
MLKSDTDPRQALALLESEISIRDTNVAALTIAARLALADGDPVRAFAYSNRTIAIAGLRLRHAVEHQFTGSGADELKAHWTNALAIRARAALQLHRLPEAIQDGEALVDYDLRTADGYLVLRDCYAALGDDEKATKYESRYQEAQLTAAYAEILGIDAQLLGMGQS